MKKLSFFLAAVLLSSPLAPWMGAAQAGPSAKGLARHHGGRAAEHRSEKGQWNTNSQWSADPERGWVRAEERHQMRNPKAPRGERNHKGKGQRKK